MAVTPNTPSAPRRRGIVAGGNFIVDTIVLIDGFPAEEMLANVVNETPCNGGGPYNVLRNLAALGGDLPLASIGLVGDDDHGRWILEDCARHGIATDRMHSTVKAPTSHTYVMTDQTSGRRTFFHHRGANGLLDIGHFDFGKAPEKIFYLGYLMLLDRLDRGDDTGRTGASRVLQAATEAGLITAVDLVSVSHPDFAKIVSSSLSWIDHLIINEVEAGHLIGKAIDATDPQDLTETATRILAFGVREAVIIHTPSGAVAASHSEGNHALGSVQLPAALAKGSNGAGDGFAAGYLHGLHEAWPMTERLKLASATAAASLADPSPSAGVVTADECLQLADQFGHRSWVEIASSP